MLKLCIYLSIYFLNYIIAQKHWKKKININIFLNFWIQEKSFIMKKDYWKIIKVHRTKCIWSNKFYMKSVFNILIKKKIYYAI